MIIMASFLPMWLQFGPIQQSADSRPVGASAMRRPAPSLLKVPGKLTKEKYFHPLLPMPKKFHHHSMRPSKLLKYAALGEPGGAAVPSTQKFALDDPNLHMQKSLRGASAQVVLRGHNYIRDHPLM